MIGTPHGQFAFFSYLDKTVEYACSPAGVFARDKIRVKMAHSMTKLLRVYRSYLKPTGGSYAGNEAKDGEPDLQAVIASLTDEDPDESVTDKYSLAAQSLLGLIVVDLRDGYLRTECPLFNEFVDGTAPSLDVYELLDSMMLDLHPLEALMLGPSTCLELDRHHALSFDYKFNYQELAAWSKVLHEAFRQVVHPSSMPHGLEAHRREHIKDLVYLSSKDVYHRVGSGGESLSMRAAAKELLKKICHTRPFLDGPAVDALMLEFRQLHSKAHLTTRPWQPEGFAARGRAAMIANQRAIQSKGIGARIGNPGGIFPRAPPPNLPAPEEHRRRGRQDSTRISPFGNRTGGRGGGRGGGSRVTITDVSN